MKNILIATTALVATAGIAHAEVAVSGSAAAGLKYNSQTAEKAWLFSKVNIAFDASGETDGGLQFGFNTNHIVENNGGVGNDDTTVYMSGAFGKLSFGAVAEADEQAGLSDIGWDGLDVDDVAEAVVGDELGDLTGASLGHNVNYTYATGPVSFSLSTRLGTSGTGSVADSSAIGAKYSFGTGYVGLGYGDHDLNGTSTVAAIDKARVLSVFGGVNVNNIKVSALYSDANFKDAAGVKTGANAYGLNASYTMDALTLSFGASKANFDAATGIADQSAYGIGASYDLGGGATLAGGIARVKSVNDENQSTVVGASDTETRADFGVSFSF
ncbi:porin [Pseudorhodobacter wandonensis]|uniref:porin n=1 Tax=Pseudorhodobacter wandonensis TaxID=1120568 RepID=UPI00067CA66A|nr:porin [Pseudorhodobacter wandonensis]